MSEQYHLAEWAGRKDGPYVAAFLFPLEIQHNRVLLDLGCGSGYVNMHVTSHCAPRHNIGMDHEVTTIELARRLNPGNAVKWVCASAEFIPLPDASVDYIVCRVVAPYVHVDTLFGEISRILRPGGKVVFSLHSWTFYLKWLSVTNPRRSLFAVVHFLVGAWFSFSGLQVRLRWRNRAIGQTWQTLGRVRKILERMGMTTYKVVRTPEFLVYAQKASVGSVR